jgi:hypothetical protein
MHMIRKGQLGGAEKGNIRAQNQLIARLLGFNDLNRNHTVASLRPFYAPSDFSQQNPRK